MTDAPLVLPFSDGRCRDALLSGGKGASLAVMTGVGLPVPPGFVVTAAAFAEAVDQANLQSLAVAKDMAGVRAVVGEAQPPLDLIAQHYSELCGSVAVRSSACAEDSAAASYAGQQETYLNVDTFESVLAYVVECWLSFFSERAMFYRQEKGELRDVSMAVVIQQMVNSRVSGVLFTVDPVHGRRDRMVVEAAHGLGEAVVSGSVTPDHYVLDRKGVIKRSHLSVADGPVLKEEEIKRLAELGDQVADLYGCPQDIEWAIDDNNSLFLLQARPVTTI